MALVPELIPTNEQIRESLADRFYHPYKRQIWVVGALLAVAIVGFLAIREYRRSREDDMWSRYYEATRTPLVTSIGGADRAAARRQAETLQALVREYPEGSVAPFALQGVVEAQTLAGDYEEALRSLDDLRSRFKDFALAHLPADPDPKTGAARSLAQRLEAMIQREREWSKLRTYQHVWPAEDRLALVETNVGSFWLGFYGDANQAPRHVEEFISRAKKGFYNGTQVYAVRQGVDGNPESFEAGSAASSLTSPAGARNPGDHDREDPQDTIEPEDSIATLRHLYRMVSAVVMQSGESASRFLVVTQKNGLDKLNGESTPFAAVMDREKSIETIDRIGTAPTYGTGADTKDAPWVLPMRDHPSPPVYIRRLSIWRDEKIEDGHEWDTSRAGKDEPEPWEKGIKPPTPEELAEPKKLEIGK